jgi:hypothetical protein
MDGLCAEAQCPRIDLPNGIQFLLSLLLLGFNAFET